MRRIGSTLTYMLIGIVSITSLFPIYWMYATSFKTRADAFARPPVIIFEPTLYNYERMFREYPLLRYLENSIIIAAGSAILAVTFGTLAAYSITRFNFKGSKDLALWMLSIRTVPPIVVIIPLFLLFREAGMLDTPASVILAHAVFNIPFAVWLMRGYLKDVPVDFEEAAMMDGCSRFEAFWRIVLPLISAGLAATVIFCVILSWNEFLMALILTETNKTLPVAAAGFVTDKDILWGDLTATGAIVILPIVVFTLLTQKYIVRGLTWGAIKG